MIHATAHVNLPSAETERRTNPVDWVRSLFGGKVDLRSGREQITVSGLSLVEGVWRALGEAGVHDAVSLLVDRRVIYLDRNEVTHDLSLVLEAAQEKGVLDRPFREMHLVASHRDAGLHILIDLQVTAEVLLGEAEMVLRVSARPEALRVQPGETSEAYQARVRTFTANSTPIDLGRATVDRLARFLGEALERSLVGAHVSVESSRVQLVAPAKRTRSKFGALGFGRAVTSTSYRPMPTSRRGAYADPFVHYYYDPYWDFTSFLLINSMINDHHWASDTVHVVDPGGTELFTGATADNVGWGSDAVDGGSDGWGGSDTGTSDGWGGSDVGSDTSSCGSSCGGGGD